MFATEVIPSKCLEYGTNCPTPLNGYICIDAPGFCDSLYKTGYWTGYADSVQQATAWNISPLYQLDAFDWTMLILYFAILTVLAIYGAYRVKQVIDFWRYRSSCRSRRANFAEADLPRITVQLPLFNEMYVVERLVKAVTEIDYPRDRLEIQVLDDSTDETVKIAQRDGREVRRARVSTFITSIAPIAPASKPARSRTA